LNPHCTLFRMCSCSLIMMQLSNQLLWMIGIRKKCIHVLEDKIVLSQWPS
jgi:hypothetical protein